MKNLLTSFKLSVLTLLTCCVVYPLIVFALAHVTDAKKAGGSLVQNETGEIVGSRLIAQEFSQPKYFWSRPSAVAFHGAAAGGSNLAPKNPELTKRALEMIEKLTPAEGQLVPADLLTTSGSGLDPHISEAAARFQSARVAATRNLTIESVDALVEQYALFPSGRLTSKRIVNVLELNLALDASQVRMAAEKAVSDESRSNP